MPAPPTTPRSSRCCRTWPTRSRGRGANTRKMTLETIRPRRRARRDRRGGQPPVARHVDGSLPTAALRCPGGSRCCVRSRHRGLRCLHRSDQTAAVAVGGRDVPHIPRPRSGTGRGRHRTRGRDPPGHPLHRRGIRLPSMEIRSTSRCARSTSCDREAGRSDHQPRRGTCRSRFPLSSRCERWPKNGPSIIEAR